MVTQAFDEGLMERIQNFVATDINSKFPLDDTRQRFVRTSDVFITYFSRVMNSWKAYAITDKVDTGGYELVHDGTTGRTIVRVYDVPRTIEAVI